LLPVQKRKLGLFSVSAIGLGCMNLSHAYGTPPDPRDATRLLQRALELGITHFDTAALYGFGANETLLAEAIGHRRREFMLASKGGMFKGADGKREIDGRPAALRRHCEASLRRLRTDVIDLYYLHRWDKRVPIEESVGELGRLVQEGKALSIGLSEVSAATIRKAHAVHSIAAVQTEYSLWTRNPEIAVIAVCREIGAALVAFSPLARGYLTGKLLDVSAFAPGDIRRPMPRFAPEAYPANLALLDGFSAEASEHGCTMGQLALGWLLAKGEDILPIPGTANIAHLEENAGGAGVALDAGTVARLDGMINQHTVRGPRYPAAVQAEIDTEEF
jgi:aryl-alcohol dehydrogenase-like predicted oxidoreductase